jgi:uncharacterized protein (DUF427 family)
MKDDGNGYNEGVPMSQLIEDRVISRIDGEHTVRLEPCAKRVRVYFGGVPVADSTLVQVMFETGHLPVYYFPVADVGMDHLDATGHHTRCPHKGEASYYTVRAGGKAAQNAAWHYRSPLPGALPELANLIAFYWAKMDRWLEEDDEAFVHPRDPYHRVDVLPREYLGGYQIIDVPDLDAALDWAARCPGAKYGRVEVRPLAEF